MGNQQIPSCCLSKERDEDDHDRQSVKQFRKADLRNRYLGHKGNEGVIDLERGHSNFRPFNTSETTFETQGN